MVSSRAKGRRNELLCQKKLEEKGWITYLVPPKQRFSSQCDVWEIFDIIAYKEQQRMYVQVKTNQFGSTRKQLEEWSNHHKNNYEMIQLWVWIDNKGWKIYNL